MMVAEHNPREGRGSLMVLQRSVGGAVVVNHVMRMSVGVMTRVMVRVVAATVVVVSRLLCRLPLTVLLVLHPPVLEPYLHLALGQVEVPRELPSLLLGDVGVEEELFLQLQCLELTVRLALLASHYLSRPLQRAGASSHARHADDRQSTCNQGRVMSAHTPLH